MSEEKFNIHCTSLHSVITEYLPNVAKIPVRIWFISCLFLAEYCKLSTNVQCIYRSMVHLQGIHILWGDIDK